MTLHKTVYEVMFQYLERKSSVKNELLFYSVDLVSVQLEGAEADLLRLARVQVWLFFR